MTCYLWVHVLQLLLTVGAASRLFIMKCSVPQQSVKYAGVKSAAGTAVSLWVLFHSEAFDGFHLVFMMTLLIISSMWLFGV